MNVTVENLAPCKKLLRIEVPAQEVDSAINNMVQEFQRVVRLPGFRPGKAPRKMVSQKFEPDILDEVKKRLIPDSFRKAIKKEELKLVGYPDIEEIQFGKGQPLMFAATVETAPEFELPEYRGIEVKITNQEVTDEDVDKAIDMLRDRQGKYESVRRELKEGDIAVVNFTGTSEGKPIAEIDPASKGVAEQKNFWVNMTEDSFIPGFSKQLEGAKAGDKRTVEVTFPPDFVSQELAGKPAVYEVEVVEVKERKLPEVNQEFAESFGAESPEKLREGVRKDLENELKSKKARDTRNQIGRHLLNATKFDLPEGVVEAETRNVVYQIVQENQNRGVSQDTIEAQKSEIFNAANATAREKVQIGFLMRQIAEKEEIKITQDEINTRVYHLSQIYQIPIEKFVKDLKNRNGVAEIQDQLMNEKVMKFLEDNAKITPVDPKELAPEQQAS